MHRRKVSLVLIAAAALALPLLALQVSAGSQNITHSTCQGYGNTEEFAGYTGASTGLTSGPSSDCWRYLQFWVWDPVFGGFIEISETDGYSNQWADIGFPTNAESYHRIRKDGVGGEANVWTHSW